MADSTHEVMQSRPSITRNQSTYMSDYGDEKKHAPIADDDEKHLDATSHEIEETDSAMLHYTP